MGEHIEGQLYYLLGTEYVPIKEIPEINFDSEDEMKSLLKPLSFTFTMPKKLRCKSAKRFVKLMMAEGFSRNDAVECVQWVRKMYRSYNHAWLIYLFQTKGVTN